MHVIKSLILVSLFALAPHGLAVDTPPAAITTEEMDVLLNSADEAYNAGDYEHAYKLYRNELALRGNAFGQYTTGYMLQNGQGVAADPVTGSAWMTLAAEQGNKQLMDAARKARRGLDREQKKRANATYLTLKETYGDCAQLAARIAELEDTIAPQTGSRIAENANRITVAYQNGSDSNYQQRQLELRKMLKAQQKAYRNGCRGSGR